MKNIMLFFVWIFALTTYGQYKTAPNYLLNKPFSKEVLAYEVQDFNGDTVSLDELIKKHKGKKVVLDFWASWCRDCLKDIPAAKKLKGKTKNTDYVYISLDKTEDVWKSAIKRWDIKGDHYLFKEGWKNMLTNYIDLDWVPRYVVLNEEGIIIVPKAIKISDKKIRKKVN